MQVSRIIAYLKAVIGQVTKLFLLQWSLA